MLLFSYYKFQSHNYIFDASVPAYNFIKPSPHNLNQFDFIKFCIEDKSSTFKVTKKKDQESLIFFNITLPRDKIVNVHDLENLRLVLNECHQQYKIPFIKLMHNEIKYKKESLTKLRNLKNILDKLDVKDPFSFWEYKKISQRDLLELELDLDKTILNYEILVKHEVKFAEVRINKESVFKEKILISIFILISATFFIIIVMLILSNNKSFKSIIYK